MPIIKSAKKRVKQTRKATVRNAAVKRSLRSALKTFIKKPTATGHQKAQSNLDRAAKKGLLHKNKVARKKRQLAAAAKKAGVKSTPSTKKAASKKTTVKTTAKKAPAKKATSKKKTTKKK